jgi:heterotetrameric sarcosine oxidase gamma subunit
MSGLHSILVPRPPFSGLPVATNPGRGVIVTDRDGLGVATVLARNGTCAALAQRVHEHFRIALPRTPRRTSSGDLALLGTGPGAWLATFERGGNAFAVSLRQAVGDLAAVSDQSDGYSVLRLAGPRVRDLLCKLVPVDVHPHVFEVGDVAATVAAHIGATLWRLEDHTDGSPVFEVAVFRSLAACFWQILSEDAAEFGFEEVRSEPSLTRSHGQFLQGKISDALAELAVPSR